MIPVPNVAYVRRADAYTIEHEPVSSERLMERAATAIFHKIFPKLQPDQPVIVFVGMGNNGGDGLVVARLLAQQAVKVEVFILKLSEKGSPDFELNLERLSGFSEVKLFEIAAEGDLPVSLPENAVILDALFGSGLNKEVTGLAARLIRLINTLGNVVVSVDVPSGLFVDQSTDFQRTDVIRADYTFTFEWPKMAFFFPENEAFVGDWSVIPIGLHRTMHQPEGQYVFLTEHNDISRKLHSRSRFAHKGNFGHALLLAGASDKTGAAILAASACLRSGAGLLHVHLPYKAASPLQCVLPEAMVSLDSDDNHLSILPQLTGYDAIAIGPGIGKEESTARVLKLLIQEAKVPLVLDADALNLLSENPTWLSFLPNSSILTPHHREFERLSGSSSNGFERIQKQRELSQRFHLIIVLKGGFTSVSLPDGTVFFNPTGNPGMATAGSGDVLTGVILSLMAQYYEPADAALIGVYLHGLAGDLALKQQSPESLLASDIVKNLGKAFTALRG